MKQLRYKHWASDLTLKRRAGKNLQNPHASKTKVVALSHL